MTLCSLVSKCLKGQASNLNKSSQKRGMKVMIAETQSDNDDNPKKEENFEKKNVKKCFMAKR